MLAQYRREVELISTTNDHCHCEAHFAEVSLYGIPNSGTISRPKKNEIASLRNARNDKCKAFLKLTPIFLALVAFMFSACSASRETPASSPRQQSTVEGQERSTLTEYEASFRPSDYDEDVELARKRASSVTVGMGNTTRPDSVSVEEETALGFRIQIFASADIYEANAAKQAAAGIITKDSLYVVYDPPVYKVRVGDYASRFDANRALPTIVDLGYSDAWVVNDKIIKRKVTVIKRPGN